MELILANSWIQIIDIIERKVYISKGIHKKNWNSLDFEVIDELFREDVAS